MRRRRSSPSAPEPGRIFRRSPSAGAPPSNGPSSGALLGFSLAVLALLLLAIAPVGWRAGWRHFRFAFTWLMASSGVIAAMAAVVSVLAFVLGWSELGARGVAMAAIGLLLGAVLVYVPWQYNKTRSTVPRIHDITTDSANPPEFAAVLPARAAEKAASAAYEGPNSRSSRRPPIPIWHRSN
jgi:hypothetical protein